MNSYKLTETLAVSGQISAELVADIAAAGYKVLLNNRPDGEEGGQPSSAEIAEAAVAAAVALHAKAAGLRVTVRLGALWDLRGRTKTAAAATTASLAACACACACAWAWARWA